uniref:Putative ixodes 10 kDa peptide protein n=1 Tax=Ixodes ricinus TaxID=34613 RepID=A0A0K8RNC1_IXORI
MQLVVFAVVLILPSFLSGESSSHITAARNECEVYIQEGGDRECTRLGSEFVRFDSGTCTVKCKNGNGKTFTDDVCSRGEVNCTSDVAAKLRTWAFSK